MRYHYIDADCIRNKTATPLVVRKATKQGKLVVLATEEPTGDHREVLLMAGKQGRDRIPVVFGDDSSVANIVGSAVVRTQTDRLVGVLGFASDDQAQAAQQGFESGELSLSLITKPLTGVELKAGERFNGIDGPAMVLTRWEPTQIVLSPN